MKHTLTIRSSGSSKAIVLNFVTLDYLSPGFHMIVPDSKNFETIRKARTICNFHTIVSIASKNKRRLVVSDVFGSEDGIFARDSQTSRK